MKRYIRQIPVIGEEGQDKLAGARIFIAGAGGLGTIISTYLTLAGVGFIRIVDDDIVEESDFNRQILHWQEDLGRNKNDSISNKLTHMNPTVQIEALSARIDPSNARDLTHDCDLIIDALDNFAARYLLNRVAIMRKIPFFHGAISAFSGQATTIVPFSTPCLRCFFPDIPDRQAPSVIGTSCCLIGAIQANEVIKYVCSKGELLTGKLLLWDGLRNEVELLEVERNPTCPDCHQKEKIY